MQETKAHVKSSSEETPVERRGSIRQKSHADQAGRVQKRQMS